MKRNLILAAGLVVFLGIGSTMGMLAGAGQNDWADEAVADGSQGGTGELEKAHWDGETPADQTGDYTEGSQAAETDSLPPEQVLDTVKMWGTVLETGDGSFSFERHFEEGPGMSEEVIVHIDPESTLVLEGVNGFPMELSQLKKGETVYVYAGPAMTLSLPPQVTAVAVIGQIPQDAAAPAYVRAAKALEEDGVGGFRLNTTDGQEYQVPADCPITPFLTRQMVSLSDIGEGSRMLVWMGADGKTEKIVLFND